MSFNMDEAVRQSTESANKRAKELVDKYNCMKGQKVKQLTYLLEGTVVGGFDLGVFGGGVRMEVNWDNGAHSYEFPASVHIIG